MILLVANRGEIACRIARTCIRLGVRPVGVFTAADRGSLHSRLLESVEVPSYLDIPAVIRAATRLGATAVHPGYGFLAENPAFARAVVQAGMLFLGPSPEAMEALGDKRKARAIPGLPILPGGSPEATGYPLLIKAAHGGGGRGMRRVDRPEDLEAALEAARREALSGFGSEDVFVEKLLVEPRHIEVQFFGDTHGRVIALGERECSLQRRYQKIIEEAPAPGLTQNVRAHLAEAAIKAATAVGYVGAGTAEFLVQGTEFYFLEANARLQVEHPVTEEVTGVDLVEWQLRVATGERLPDPPSVRGHALECRLCAEDSRSLLPAAGEVLEFRPGPCRADSGIFTGDVVGTGYDSMLAKLITVGPTRAEAVRKMLFALEETVLLGVESNLELLRHLVGQPDFAAGRLHTGFIEQHPLPPRAKPHEATLQALVLSEASGGFGRATSGPREVVDEDGATFTVTPAGTLQGSVLERDGHRQPVLVRDGWVWTRHETRRLQLTSLWPVTRGKAGEASLRTPMPGQVIAVLAGPGDPVVAGQPLLRLEAMKMEHTVSAPYDGVVEAVHFAVGEQVGAQAELVTLRAG